MSLVGKAFAPALLIGSSAFSLYQHREALLQTRATTLVKGSVSLAMCIAMQLALINRCAMGGKPSNLKGLFAIAYHLLLPMSAVLTYMLFREIPLHTLVVLAKGFLRQDGSRLGASGNQPVYQYRLNDVIDRVRDIVGDRINNSSDDFRER